LGDKNGVLLEAVSKLQFWNSDLRFNRKKRAFGRFFQEAVQNQPGFETASLIKNKTFMVRNNVFPIRNKTFLVRNDIFLIRNKAFLVRNGVFLIRNKTFLIRNGIFLIRNKAFMVRNDVFLIRNRVFLTRKTPCSGMASSMAVERYILFLQQIKLKRRRFMPYEGNLLPGRRERQLAMAKNWLAALSAQACQARVATFMPIASPAIPAMRLNSAPCLWTACAQCRKEKS
jgi:hypothetical protein